MLSHELVAIIERGDVQALKQALARGLDPDERDSEWWPALKIAARAGQLEIVECLVAAGVDVDGWAECGDEDTVEVEIDVDGMSFLEAEQAEAALEALSPLRPWREKLAAMYAKDDPVLNLDSCQDALTTALVFGHILVARVLIHAGATLDEDTDPMLIAAATGRADMIDMLLQAGAPIEPKHVIHTPLFEASMRNHVDAVRALVAGGAPVESGDLSGHTPLMIAAGAGAREVAEILVAAGANPARESEGGDSALSFAAEYGHRELYQFLVRAIRA